MRKFKLIEIPKIFMKIKIGDIIESKEESLEVIAKKGSTQKDVVFNCRVFKNG